MKKVHGNTHSNASQTAKIENVSLPIIVHNDKWDYHSLMNTRKENVTKQNSLDIFHIIRKQDIELFQNTIQVNQSRYFDLFSFHLK